MNGNPPDLNRKESPSSSLGNLADLAMIRGREHAVKIIYRGTVTSPSFFGRETFTFFAEGNELPLYSLSDFFTVVDSQHQVTISHSLQGLRKHNNEVFTAKEFVSLVNSPIFETEEMKGSYFVSLKICQRLKELVTRKGKTAFPLPPIPRVVSSGRQNGLPESPKVGPLPPVEEVKEIEPPQVEEKKESSEEKKEENVDPLSEEKMSEVDRRSPVEYLGQFHSDFFNSDIDLYRATLDPKKTELCRLSEILRYLKVTHHDSIYHYLCRALKKWMNEGVEGIYKCGALMGKFPPEARLPAGAYLLSAPACQHIIDHEKEWRLSSAPSIYEEKEESSSEEESEDEQRSRKAVPISAFKGGDLVDSVYFKKKLFAWEAECDPDNDYFPLVEFRRLLKTTQLQYRYLSETVQQWAREGRSGIFKSSSVSSPPPDSQGLKAGCYFLTEAIGEDLKIHEHLWKKQTEIGKRKKREVSPVSVKKGKRRPRKKRTVTVVRKHPHPPKTETQEQPPEQHVLQTSQTPVQAEVEPKETPTQAKEETEVPVSKPSPSDLIQTLSEPFECYHCNHHRVQLLQHLHEHQWWTRHHPDRPQREMNGFLPPSYNMYPYQPPFPGRYPF